jgi:hypothetical protein
MGESNSRSWVETAVLIGAVYLAIGLAFTALSGAAASRSWFYTWRFGAWVVSGAAYAAHIAYEHFRFRRPPAVTAFHAATAVAFGGFGLAAAATAHALAAPARPPNLWRYALALVLWPLFTAVPAYAVAIAGTSVLAWFQRRPGRSRIAT